MGYEGTGANPINAALLADLRGAVKEIQWRAVVETRSATLIAMSVTRFGHDAVITGVTPLKGSWSPERGTAKDGAITIHFAGNWLGRVVERYPIPGARVTLYLGTAQRVESEFQQVFRGYVKETPIRTETGHSLKVDAAGQLARGLTFQGIVPGDYPGRVLEIVLNDVNFSGDWVNADGFDPANSVTMGHVGVELLLDSTAKVDELARNLLGLVDAAPLPGLDGRWRLATWDPSRPPIRTIAQRVMLRRNQIAQEPLVNRLDIDIPWHELDDRDQERTLRFDEGQSQADHGYPGSPAFIATRKRDLKLAVPRGVLLNTFFSSGYFIVSDGPARRGFAGACLEPGQRVVGGTTSPAQAISAARPAYIMLIDAAGSAFELVRCEVAIHDWSSPFPYEGYTWPSTLRYNIAQRGLLGFQHPGDLIGGGPASPMAVDCTIPWILAHRELTYRSYGAPRADVLLDIGHMDLGLNDPIALDEDLISHFGLNGARPDETWVITGQGVQGKGDRAGTLLSVLRSNRVPVGSPPMISVSVVLPDPAS